MELLSRFRTTKHITRQLNTQSLKSWHCHTGDFDDIYDENVRQKQSKGDMAASLNHFSNVSGFVAVMSYSGSHTDYCLCVKRSIGGLIKMSYNTF